MMKIRNKWWFYPLAATLVFQNFSYAQVAKKAPDRQSPPAVAAASDQALPFDPNVVRGKLKNGFTYYIRRNTEPKDRAQMYLVTKAGSVLENDQQQGLAHFMEHMSFNGTRHFPKNALVNYLQKSGVRFGADLNAYTSFDETVYELPIPTDDPEVFKNGMQIMRDWAHDASLDQDEIDKERGVVLEEKRLGKGAQERMQNKYLPLIFNNSRYSSRLPIGKEDILKNFSRGTLMQFYRDWYRPNLQALIVVGDIDVKKTEQMVREKFSDLENPKAQKPRTEYKIPLLNKNQFIAVTDKEFPVTVAQILIKHPEKKVKTVKDLRDNVVRSLYNQMLSARFSELTKQANPPFVQAGSNISDFMAGLDVASTFVVAKPGELEKGFKAAYTETERVKRFGFTQTELDREKQDFMTAIETAYKERDKTPSDQFVQEYVQHFLKGEASPGIVYEYNFYTKHLPEITLAEVNSLAKTYLTDINRDIILMAPEKDKGSLPDEARVNSWIREVKAQNIAAYVDEVSDKPLLANEPTPGKVVSEKKVPELGITELKLSNGVRVILKPTTFKNDEISFSAFSPGGTSIYSDSLYESAANASVLVAKSGLGPFNSIQLPKMLAGKSVYVSPYISERYEGIYSSSTPKDLKTALQLTYMYFTEPRSDSSIYKAFITQQKATLANREDDPNSVFSDTIAAVVGNHNIRRSAPSIDKLEQIKLDKAFQIYKQRFADASDFTFTFVGSFNVDSIRPLLEQYIGSLPSLNRNEEWKDLGLYPPKGKIEKVVYKGQEQKATVRMIFTGDYKYGEDNNNQLNALGEVLQIKLIERLREEESGVYSPGVRVTYSKYPRNRFGITIGFGCAPENVDKLVAATLDEINRIKKNGAQPDDVAKFLAEERRTTEVQLKENSFWASYLADQYQNNEDPKQVLTYLENLKKITPASLKDAANHYLSGENYMKFVLLPEAAAKSAASK